MNEQALDLRRAWWILWRHKIIVGVFIAVGLLLGAGYGFLKPPMMSSSALVVLSPSTRDVPTQVLIASSNPVLSRALPGIRPAMTLQELHERIHARNPTPNIISITAQGMTAAQVESMANAVADSYVGYITRTDRATKPVQAQARLLQAADTATGQSLPPHLILNGLPWALIAGVIGAIGVLAVNRQDRRLRARDEIANAIGVPVLASVPTSHPTDAARWAKLFGNYHPSVVNAWQLRIALSYLGQADVAPANGRGGGGERFSIGVVTLSTDRAALALGPQLAVFAASLGIPTTLLIGPQQGTAAAALRAACAEPPPSAQRPRTLRLAVTDHEHESGPPARLTVAVTVVDSQDPSLADVQRTTATVIGVSAGAATAAQLVGVAVSAASSGRQVDGILVADPDPADHTTGRIPQLARPPRRRTPTRLTGTTTERTR
jgi:capsular polysaccharide biosynthesis protein